VSRLEPGRIRAENLGRRFEIAAQGGRSLRATLLRREYHKPREFWALRHVDLDIAPGETFGIVGRNGSGKSTLLKMLARIFGPTEGSCEVGGRLSSLLELGAGFHPEFSAIENIYLSAAIYGIPRDEVRRDIESIIDFAELEEFKDQPVKTFSSGMFARLGFSVAMHVKPDVLLLDEALSVGDEQFVQKCLGRIGDYRSDGGTMILVSHDASTVERVCDRALFLLSGEPVIIGTATEAIDAYRSSLAASGGAEHLPANAMLTPDDFEIVVEPRTPSGEPRNGFGEGQPLTLALTIRMGTPSAMAFATLTMRDATQRELGSIASPDFECAVERTMRLNAAFAALPLRAGTFRIDVTVFESDTKRMIAMVRDVATLTITPRSGRDSGAVAFRPEWSIEAESPSPTRS
jgi:lipopolysaccharide transport system ATP-binding protein